MEGLREGALHTYFRPGHESGHADHLAEALRMDGCVPSLGPALGAARDATLRRGWFGTDDDGEDTECDALGWTPDGSLVEALPCVYATVGVDR